MATGVGVLGIFDAGSVAGLDQAAELGGARHRRRRGRGARRPGRSPSSSTPCPTPRSWRRCPDCPGATRRASTGSRSRSSRRRTPTATPSGVDPVRAAPADARRGAAGPATGWCVTSSPMSRSARRDDRAPVWLSEGLAEYVSVQSLPPEKRTISRGGHRGRPGGRHRDAARRLLQRRRDARPRLGQLRHRLVRLRVPRRELRRGHPVAAAVGAQRAGRRRGQHPALARSA